MNEMELEDYSDHEQNESETQTEELDLESNNYIKISDICSEEMIFTQCLPSNIINVFSGPDQKGNTSSNILQERNNQISRGDEIKHTINAIMSECKDISHCEQTDSKIYKPDLESLNNIQASDTHTQEINIIKGVPTNITNKVENKNRIKATMSAMELEDFHDNEQNNLILEELDLKSNNHDQKLETYSQDKNFTKSVDTNLIQVFGIETRKVDTVPNIVQKKSKVQNNQITKKLETQQKVSQKLVGKKDAATQTTEQCPSKSTIIFKNVSKNKENMFVNIEMANCANNNLMIKPRRTIRLGLSKKWKCPEKYDE